MSSTQAEIAVRIGTTQSAVARLESAESRHSPSIATLQRYAKALGYKVQIQLVKRKRQESGSKARSSSTTARQAT